TDRRRGLLNAGGTPPRTDSERIRLEWRTHHAAQHPRTPCHPCLWPWPLLAAVRGHRAAAGQGLPHRLLIGHGPSGSCAARWATAIAPLATLLGRDAEVGMDRGTEPGAGSALG